MVGDEIEKSIIRTTQSQDLNHKTPEQIVREALGSNFELSAQSQPVVTQLNQDIANSFWSSWQMGFSW